MSAKHQRFSQSLRVLHAFVSAHEAVDRLMRVVLEEEFDEIQDDQNAECDVAEHGEREEAERVMTDLRDRISRHPTRTIARFTPDVFRDHIRQAWTSASTKAEQQNVLAMLERGVASNLITETQRLELLSELGVKSG